MLKKQFPARLFGLFMALVFLCQMPVFAYAQTNGEQAPDEPAVVETLELQETGEPDGPAPEQTEDDLEPQDADTDAKNEEDSDPAFEPEVTPEPEPDASVPEPTIEPDELGADEESQGEENTNEQGVQRAAMASLEFSPFSLLPAPGSIASIFPDPLLAEYVAGLLGKGVGDTVTQSELNSITQFTPSGRKIQNLEGIQYLNNIQTARLDNMQLLQRFPEAFVTDIRPFMNFYIANNQRYESPDILITDYSLQAVIDQLPPLFQQIVENSGGAVVGTWTIRDANYGGLATLPAVNGSELLPYASVLGTGRHTVELDLNSGVWMGLDSSIYIFHIVVEAPQPGSISGTVTGQDGGALGGITITLTLPDGTTTATATDANGGYSFPGLTAGNYTVMASGNGYYSQTKGATVSAGNNTVVNFTMVAQTGSIAGIVLDAQTQQPLPGAAVVLYNDTTGQYVGATTAGPDGRFSFANLPAGLYRAIGSMANYNTNFATQGVGGGVTTEMAIELSRVTYLLYGYVYDAGDNNAPLANATVNVPGAGAVQTNASGYYEIRVTPGTYNASASYTGYVTDTHTGIVVAGDRQEDFYLTPQPVEVIVYTRYLDENGDPAEDVTLTLDNGEVRTTGASGTETFSLQPGSYTLTATKEGYIVQPAQHTFDIDAGEAGPLEYSFVLVPVTATISGYVYVTGTTIPVPGATVSLDGATPIPTDGNGYYEFPAAAYGTHTLFASATGYSTDTESVAVRAPGTVTQNLYLDPNPASLRIEVYYYGTSTPVTGAEISLNDGHRAMTDSDGVYTFMLAPGQYTATVTAEGYRAPVQMADLVAGGTKTLVFEIHLPPALVGIVVDGQSRVEIPGATVTITPSQGTGYTGERTTNAEGRYAFSPVDAGFYDITVSAPGYQSITRLGVEVKEDTVTTANFFPVKLTGALTGTVTYADGTPVAGAEISVNGEIAITDENGQYFFLLAAGAYMVEESTEGYSDQEKPAEVEPNRTAVVNFVLDAPPGSIYGTVEDEDGNPVAGVNITVRSSTGAAYTTTTDASGAYSVQGLPAGGYTVIASANGYGTEALQVEVEAGEATEASFVLGGSPGVLQGTVTDADTGAPIAGAVITVGPGGIVVTTDANGRYRVALTAGSYTVTASVEGRADQSSAFTIADRQTVTRDFAFGAPVVDGGGGEGGGSGATGGGVATGDAGALGFWLLLAVLGLCALPVAWRIKRRL